jgi:hypothetical protein
MMRTTVTFDPDVAAQIERLRATERRPFKDVVNELLRLGLAQRERGSPVRGGPYTKAVSLGRSRLPDLDDVSEALTVAEGEDHR